MNAIYLWITEPFSYPFMQNALITALLVSVVCAMLSCYLVLKGWSLMGDAISHAVLPGIVVAFWLGLPLSVGAFIAGLVCSISVGYLKENSRIKEDTAMGIVFSGMFALGIVLFTKIETEQHLTHILFGNLLGVSDAEVWQTFFMTALIFLVIFLRRKDFLLYCFDPNQTKIVGLSPRLLNYSLLILLALTIISAMQVVGVILVVAMLISPGITAFILTKRFDYMIAIALMTSVSTSILGTIISYYIDGATGPCIILLQATAFLTALIYSKIRLRFSATLETS
ncbi:iron ABC transporter permease subunit AfeD [Aggregatibacter actinomycetemcomitans]|uniref:iron ABC transporter permease subunit AfeD n=1 Tax=Aggregatibacter actinomycetemcomitans TaxID=714 RepID=UPI00197C770B|nr:iron ABC transporter permease subunit AfeD [Aggregatibacter actinomycetemcomitans]MBN6074000.1 iron ABC transporter permease subunit AfeD [Aggregatibacter actinomycetemcomitans]